MRRHSRWSFGSSLVLIGSVAACRADASDASTTASSSASSVAPSSSVAGVPSEVVPDGCDHLVVEGKHIVPKDRAVAPFKSAGGDRAIRGSYCYRGVDLTYADEVSKLDACKPRGSGQSVTFQCPGVHVTYFGLLDEVRSITVVELP